MYRPFLEVHLRKRVKMRRVLTISKSKGLKIGMLGPFLDVQTSFCMTRARDSAPGQKWAKRAGFSGSPKKLAAVVDLSRCETSIVEVRFSFLWASSCVAGAGFRMPRLQSFVASAHGSQNCKSLLALCVWIQHRHSKFEGRLAKQLRFRANLEKVSQKSLVFSFHRQQDK